MLYQKGRNVKINNGKPHYNGVKRFSRESCRPTTHPQLQTQQEEIDHAPNDAAFLPCRKKRGLLPPLPLSFPLPQQPRPWETLSLDSEKPLYFQLPVHSNGLFVCNSLPNLPFSSPKQCFSPVSCGLTYGFAVACLSQNAVLCHSQINPYFAGKLTGSLAFKVNNTQVEKS